MESIVYLLQVAVAWVFFANKVLVLVGRRSGWAVGVIGAALALVYFYLLDLRLLTVLEVGLVLLMSYGYVAHSDPSPRFQVIVRVAITLTMVTLAGFVFTGVMTAVEFTSAVLMLWGTYLLTSGQLRLGWALSAVAHALAGVVGWDKGQGTFADFQIASSIVAAIGVAINWRQPSDGTSRIESFRNT